MNASAVDKKPKTPLLRVLAALANLFWWLLLAVLVLAALYVGLGRQLTQNMDDYRPYIEQRLSEFLGQEILIGSLASRWNWLNPTIIARDLAVKPSADSDQVIGSLRNLRVGLDFLGSLQRLRIVFATFDADGLELVVNQTPQGDLGVEGADLPEPVADDLGEWIDLAGQWLSDPSVRITRVLLGLRDGRGQLRQVEIPQLDLAYHRGLFRASGRAMRPGTTEQLASFRLVGQHMFRGDFTGQLYGDINSGRLFDGLIQEYSWQNLRAEGFDVGGQIWLTFRDGRMEQASGKLQTPYLQLGVGGESLAPLEDIEARFGWRRAGDSDPGEFHLKDLSWRWNGIPVPGFDLRFQAGSQTNTLVADRLSIAPVLGLLGRLQILPGRFAEALDDYAPAGTLNRLRLTTEGNDGGQFQLTAELGEASVQAHRGAPAVQGLNGSLVMNRSGGFVQADSAALQLSFPALFRGPWAIRDFRAGIGWRLEDTATWVYGDDIAMAYGDGTRLTGAFDLKLVAGGTPELGVRVGVEDGTADMLADFVPVQLVSPGLYSWLTTAIEQAHIVQGTYFGHGQIGRDAPPGAFVSSMVYDFDQARVQYDERWPEVTDASGRVFVHQGRTRVDLASGQTGGLQLQPGQVRVEPGNDAGGSDGQGTMVYLDAAAPVPGEALADWMNTSPLGELAGDAIDGLQIEGNYYLDLSLSFPLDAQQRPDIQARVRAESGSLSVPAADLQWTEVSGDLSYSTARGFSSAPVTARFLGSPVEVRVQERPDGGGFRLRQTGGVDVATLWSRLGLADNRSPGLSGRLDYRAVLELPADKAASLRLMSDLTGVTVGWPDPLGKTAEAKAPLAIRVWPKEDASIGLSVDWQERMNLDIGLGSGRVDLAVNELQLGGQGFEDVRVNAVRGSDRWLIRIAADWIRGMTTWPIAGADGEAGPVTVDLEKLALARDAGQTADSQAPLAPADSVRALRELDLESWPVIAVRIADLQINDQDAGIWSFQLRPGMDRLDVENIDAQLKSLALTGAMSWRISNDEQRSGFRGSLRGQSLADIGALFAAEIPFQNDKTTVELDLDWPGRPDQFAMDKLSGSVSTRFDDGVILEGNSTAQLFRIFNLLNADTLWRRLKLDFSDLYEAGVAFDAISGKARLDQGVLTLDPELQIVGPSGAFKFSGTTDMAEETLDMSMVVVLPLTQNLPLAALLLGAGAPIGGALFVLDKILGDPLSKLTSATYSVSGPWDQPEVRLKRIFDDGK